MTFPCFLGWHEFFYASKDATNRLFCAIKDERSKKKIAPVSERKCWAELKKQLQAVWESIEQSKINNFVASFERKLKRVRQQWCGTMLLCWLTAAGSVWQSPWTLLFGYSGLTLRNSHFWDDFGLTSFSRIEKELHWGSSMMCAFS